MSSRWYLGIMVGDKDFKCTLLSNHLLSLDDHELEVHKIWDNLRKKCESFEFRDQGYWVSMQKKKKN